MAHQDLERVQADLTAMKSACVEPAIPVEEVAGNLITAACGILVAVAVWFVSPFVMRAGVLVLFALWAVLYIPWKRRILRNDPALRQLESREQRAFGIASLAAAAYFAWYRFTFAAGSAEASRLMGGAIFCFLGFALLAYGIAQPRRRFYVGPAIVSIVGGVLMQFAASKPLCVAILGIVVAASHLSNAVWLSLLARRQRSEHVSH